MMWLADVFTGTQSQQWSQRYCEPKEDSRESKTALIQRIPKAIRRVSRYLISSYERRRDARVLHSLSDHLLNDIGITRDGIEEYLRNQRPEQTDTRAATPEAVAEPELRYVLASASAVARQCVVKSHKMACANDSRVRAA